MVNPLGTEFTRRGRPALAAFLRALADHLGARIAYFVPRDVSGAIACSRATEPLPADELSAIAEVARQWLAGARGNAAHLAAAAQLAPAAHLAAPAHLAAAHLAPAAHLASAAHLAPAAHLTTDDGTPVDIAAVCTASGQLHGALLIAGTLGELPHPGPPAAEVELAAALLSSVLDGPPILNGPPVPAARQSLIDWLSTRPGGRVAFAISIDRLDAANEVLGDRAGDAILRALEARMERWAGPAGRLVHVDGARYLAIRTDLADESEAIPAAERLRELVAAPIDVDGLAISRSASVGVATDPLGSAPAAELLANAALSGAAARSAGGDVVRRYDEATAVPRLNRLRLGLELYDALAGGQLRMHYQPEHDLRTGRIVAVEALLRWQHPQLGLLSAERFVPYSEQTNVFAAVQRWVIDETCRQLGQWLRTGDADDLVLRVNISAPQVVDGDVTAVLLAALDRYQIPGEQVCVEITERRMPPDLAALATELEIWRTRGVLVALDDFGTGAATLSHLLHLPVDIIKLDQTFVAGLTSDPRAAAVLAGLLEISRALHVEVVAEGVDGPDTAAALLRLGCERGQGNALAQAMAPASVQALLRAQARLADTSPTLPKGEIV